ncbi:MAG: NGG1p interacting factor NIF3 [Deltaproteobacteria bacterium]|nr:NGG1p interacting factor NIF3 [Deltaproteobacteria bacterium]
MKIKDIYEKAIKRGIELDPRGADEVRRELDREKKEYDSLKEKDRKYFDTERLTNPYSDSRILCGDPEKDVKRVLVGIDMEIGEVLLADRLRERGTPIDLILSHHPEGTAMANLYDVMDMQSGILLKYGVPINVAEDIMEERIREVERRLMPANHTRAIDAARLLDVPMMCLHTPTDNAVTDFLQRAFDARKPVYVSDIIDMLKEIPEYQKAAGETFAPKAVCGSEKRRAGKVFVDMTGGTGGSKKVYEKLAVAGVGTVVGMHISEDHRKEAEKNHVNVVIAGHISSDTLGVNLVLDHVLEGVEVVETSGFKRIARTERGR